MALREGCSLLTNRPLPTLVVGLSLLRSTCY
nr:MAG TPA: hypothetical protein [Caudoviricetes sp.]DAX72985.1 MAG TPA: hypothetical protein [Caudoviricetes sp.]